MTPRRATKTRFRKRVPIQLHFFSPGLEMDSKRDPENLQKSIPDLFFRSSKNNCFSNTSFPYFYDFWHPPNLENRAKTLYCRSKSRVPAFVEKTLQSWKKATPVTSKGHPKTKKLRKRPYRKPPRKTPSKKTRKKLKTKPVLAWNGKRELIGRLFKSVGNPLRIPGETLNNPREFSENHWRILENP